MPYRPTFDSEFALELIIAAVIFGIVVLLMVYALLQSRRRTEPSQRSEAKGLERTYVLVLIGLAGFILSTSLISNADVQPSRAADGPKPLVVQVNAFQWCWRFTYPTRHIVVTGTCIQGHDLPTLVVPTGRPVRIHLTSDDVVHEWWVPHLRYKEEAFPNWTNTFQFTLSSKGDWIGRCSEFCGLFHSFMDFHLEAVSPQQYRQWSSQHAGTTLT